MLQALIKPVKISSTIGGLSYEIRDYYDTLWALSLSEVNNSSDAGHKDETGISGITNSRIMPIFTDNNSRIKKTDNNTGSAYTWWLRSPALVTMFNFRFIAEDGSPGGAYASYNEGVAFGFAL